VVSGGYEGCGRSEGDEMRWRRRGGRW
jgi:hypothetical protein